MKIIFAIIFNFWGIICFGQTRNLIGKYSYDELFSRVLLVIEPDSSFTYASSIHPSFNRIEYFKEKGKWIISGDTIILNPHLEEKPFIETDFQEKKIESDTSLILTFNHIKRYFDNEGKLTINDTVEVDRLDFAFNNFKKKSRTRVSRDYTTRCAFAGYIPPEIISLKNTITISKPSEKLESIFIGCYELYGTREFQIKDSTSNHLILNIYSNYYQDGQLRQKKFLVKNDKRIYTQQKNSGKFKKGFWHPASVIRKKKPRKRK
ncbi:hypothetical protein [Flexithrix dorotheae]|uniref:hypothetical protein n=1 Tax=Flexithrix dorotheae TaxID=70993 RepID=UPI000377865E|nr:hypothetical protein [Flexithrix dorotheae]